MKKGKKEKEESYSQTASRGKQEKRKYRKSPPSDDQDIFELVTQEADVIRKAARRSSAALATIELERNRTLALSLAPKPVFNLPVWDVGTALESESKASTKKSKPFCEVYSLNKPKHKEREKDNKDRDGYSTNRDQREKERGEKLFVYAKFLGSIARVPLCNAYVPIRRNVAKEDDKALRFLPYFGENDRTTVDMSVYSSGDDDSALDDPVDQDIVVAVTHKYDTHPEVWDALSSATNYSPEALQKSYRDLTHQGLRQRSQQERQLVRYGVDVPLNGLLDNHRKFFCRRCYMYQCGHHGLSQPRPRNEGERKLPTDAELKGAMFKGLGGTDYEVDEGAAIGGLLAMVDGGGSGSSFAPSVSPLSTSGGTKAARKTGVYEPPQSRGKQKAKGGDKSEEENDEETEVAGGSAIPTPDAAFQQFPHVPCGPHCYLRVCHLEIATGKRHFDDIQSQDRVYSANWGYAAEQWDGVWSDLEQSVLRKLVYVCGHNYCQVATIMASKTCKEVWLLVSQHPGMAVHESKRFAVSNGATSTRDSGEKKKRRRRKRLINKIKPAKTRVVGELGLAHAYTPCDHEGSCADAPASACICKQNGTFCEKFCACAKTCKNRFAGCQCRGCRCRTRACPCFAANRECDPDLCELCVPGSDDESFFYLPSRRSDLSELSDLSSLHSPHDSTDGEESGEEGKDGGKGREKDKDKDKDKDKEKDKEKEEGKVGKDEEKEKEGNKDGKKPGEGEKGGPRLQRVCYNLSVQTRQRKHLLLGKSDVHGWGAFLKTPAKKHELITEYVGEVISQDEADRRGKIYDKLNRSYLFNLNEELVVDAARKGNKIKFANHSDNPNCVSKVMLVNGDHRIGIYSKRKIRQGEELFFDYQHEHSGQAPEWFLEKKSDHGHAPKGGGRTHKN